MFSHVFKNLNQASMCITLKGIAFYNRIILLITPCICHPSVATGKLKPSCSEHLVWSLAALGWTCCTLRDPFLYTLVIIKWLIELLLPSYQLKVDWQFSSNINKAFSLRDLPLTFPTSLFKL